MIALHLIGLGEKHDAAQWLEQSYRNGSLWSLGFSSDPIPKSLRDEPGYCLRGSPVGRKAIPSIASPDASSSLTFIELTPARAAA